MLYNLPLHEWEVVGLELNIPHNDLTTIKKNNQWDVNAQKREMFSTWLRQDVHVSYGRLGKVLEKLKYNKSVTTLYKNLG